MAEYKIIRISDEPEYISRAAQWFCDKWRVPLEAYLDSMNEALRGSAVPEWYIATDEGRIIAGLGIIENDFHDRKDLAPNVCAVYVEEEYRCRGIAGKLLNRVCEDMHEKGLDTLYLLTGHTAFYERYGWEFFCMAQGDGEEELSRMYIHRT